MNIAILDDDVEFLQRFKDLLYQYLNQIVTKIHIQMIDKDFSNQLKNNKYDIIFVDIDLQETTGIEVVKDLKANHNNTIVIFVSSRNELVFEALTVQPFHFIRKTHLDEDLHIAITLIKNHIQKYSKMITLNLYGRKTSIKISDILYVESSGHNISIITSDDEYTYRSTLKEVIKSINSTDFCRIQKSIIINLSYVKEIVKNDIFLTNGSVFTINRYYKKEVLNNYKEYLLR